MRTPTHLAHVRLLGTYLMYTRGKTWNTAGYILASCAGLCILYLVGTPFSSTKDAPAGETMAQASLARLKALSPVQQRRAAAVLGALVTDAASESGPELIMSL